MTPAQQKSQYVLLSIKVSRVNEKGPLAAEQMFASLHGLLGKSSTFTDRGKSNERFSFEIASYKGNIYFFVWVHEQFKDFVEGQIYAQYPDIEIIESMDYLPESLLNRSSVMGQIEFQKHELFPLKHFEEFEEKIVNQSLDPLSGITEALSKISDDDITSIQIIAQPISDKWWKPQAEKAVDYFSKGRNPFLFKDKYATIFKNPYLRIALFPLAIILFLANLILSMFQGGESEGNGNYSISKSAVQDLKMKGILEKQTKLGFKCQIRILYFSPKKLPRRTLQTKLQTIAGSFKIFNTNNLNGFEYKEIPQQKHWVTFKKRNFSSSGLLMNTEEMASVFHLPNILVQTPTIVWVTSRKTEPPTNLPTPENTPNDQLTMLGVTNFRRVRKNFGIKLQDRQRHAYIIGKTGMGKSVLLENMIYSDIMIGRGVGVIDPHGDLADKVLSFVPSHRINDVVVIDPSDAEFPIAFNLFEDVDNEHRSLVASGIVGIFKKLFAESWGPRLEHVLRNTVLALLENKNTTMLGIMRMLVDKDYRKEIVKHVENPMVKSFWNDEFANFNPRELPTIISPIQNKVGQFLSSHIVRNILGQTKSTINLRHAMDTGKILIVNLSKGKIGEDNSALLGSMLITQFQLDAMSRAHVPEDQRRDFSLFVDEFQNFATDSFATILSEARKYHLNLTMANQYVAQMPEEVRDAVFGNVGTIATFQTGFDDAEYFKNQYGEIVTEADIVGLSKYTIYIRLLIDGMPAPVFSANTFPPVQVEDNVQLQEKIIRLSRERYGRSKQEVEENILNWSKSKSGGDKKPVQSTQPPKSNSGSSSQSSSAEEATVAVPDTPEIDINDIKVGSYIEAVVTGVTNYGIFVNHKGHGGLIHKSEVPNPEVLKKRSQTYEPGQTIKCIVIGNEDGKLNFSIDPKKRHMIDQPKA